MQGHLMVTYCAPLETISRSPTPFAPRLLRPPSLSPQPYPERVALKSTLEDPFRGSFSAVRGFFVLARVAPQLLLKHHRMAIGLVFRNANLADLGKRQKKKRQP